MKRIKTVQIVILLFLVMTIGTSSSSAAVSTHYSGQSLLALELLSGMPGNILDPDVPVVLTVNLFSPLAAAIHEQNLDREEGTEPEEIPEVSTQIDGKNWREILSLRSQEGETEKEIPFQILREPTQAGLSLGEGGVGSCRIAIEQGILSEKAVLSVLIEQDEGAIRSEKVEVRFKAGTLSQVQKLEVWIPYYLALERMDEALLKVEELIELIPQASSPYSYKAEVLEATGDLEGAKENILKAIAIYGKLGPEEDPPFLYMEQLRRIHEKISAKKIID